MIKMLEIKTCTALWDIDGTIMRFQRRKRVSDEMMGIKIAHYKELLLGNLYEAHPEMLCEINDVLDEIILVRIGFEVYRDDFLRMFKYYAQSYIKRWDKSDKVVQARKISIFPGFGKTHIRKVLMDKGIVATKADAAVDDKPSGKMSKEQKLKLKLKEKDEQIRRLSAENSELKSECELLRGRLFLLMQRHSMG